jgi:hypothetical protein
MMITKQQISILAIILVFNAFSSSIKAQTPKHSDTRHLRNGLLRSMNIFFDPVTPPTFQYEWEEKREGYSISRFIIRKDNNELVPGYLLKPDKTNPPYPVMICLQGHAPGMYISIGEARGEKDSALIQGGRDLALQAVNNGWAALVIEQKGFGERSVEGVSCNQLSLRELMAGNTMTGERVSDITLAINFIETQPDLDNKTIGCMGNSTGGTISYFAGAIDPRIALTVVSCSFSTYESSWLKYDHCACGFLPGILEIGDMPDFAALIAPRKLIIVAGKEDYIADIEGVRKGFEIAQKSYLEQGMPENIVLIEGDGGHQFYPELAWPVIQKMMGF